jgi:hypothetical protein
VYSDTRRRDKGGWICGEHERQAKAHRQHNASIVSACTNIGVVNNLGNLPGRPRLRQEETASALAHRDPQLLRHHFFGAIVWKLKVMCAGHDTRQVVI